MEFKTKAEMKKTLIQVIDKHNERHDHHPYDWTVVRGSDWEQIWRAYRRDKIPVLTLCVEILTGTIYERYRKLGKKRA